MRVFLALTLSLGCLFACSKEEEKKDDGKKPVIPVNTNTTCTTDADCANTSKKVCGDEGLCVFCKGFNEGCPEGYVCNAQGRCGVCATTSCPSERPYCALDTNGVEICVECLDDTACTGTFEPHCDTTTHACVECATDDHCQDEDQSCVELKACAENTCYDRACTSDADCALACDFPICDNGNCVECRTNSDCPGTRTCVAGFGTSKLCAICVSDSSCPSSHPKCEEVAGVCCTDGSVTNRECIACRDNSDCRAGEVCEARNGVTNCYPL